MSRDFDWRTGEEDNERWDEPLGDGVERPSFTLPPWLKKWGPWLGGILALLIIVGLVLANLFDRQVEEVEDTTSSDLLAAHQLVRQAIADEDYELLETLTGSGNNWRNLQTELLNVNLILDRQPLGLELLPEKTLSIQYTPTITLSADLQTAELREQLPYRITTGPRLSETVWLEQTYHYQRQGESWLWTAPPDNVDYWGKWNNTKYGDYFQLIYTERDKPFADYLGVRLDELIGRICNDEAIDCPPRFHVEFRLERRPDSLRQLNESYFNVSLLATQNIYHFDMPSPTLIGRPLEEADYEVLYRGYANWLAAIMAARYLSDGGFFEGNPFELTLANWGLEPPPLPVMPMPIPQTIAPPPIPFPDQDVLVVCDGFNTSALLRYNPRTNQWLDEIDRLDLAGVIFDMQLPAGTESFNGFNVSPLPDDSGFLASSNFFSDEGNRSFLTALTEAGLSFWLEQDFYMELFPGATQEQFDRNGRKWVVAEYVFSESETGGESFLIPFAIDLEACRAGNCTLESYTGIPHWSPDLNWALLVNAVTQSDIALQNEATGERIELGKGYSPYWLDNENFVYIAFEEAQSREDEPALISVVQASVTAPLSGTVLLDSRDISRAVADGNPDIAMNINSVVAHPDQPDWFFMSVNTSPLLDPMEYFILDFRADTAEINVLVEEEALTLTAPFRIIQDGRFLLIQSFSAISPQTEYRLIPLDPEQKTAGTDIQSFTAFQSFRDDVSADERWLLIVEQGNLRFVAPGYNYNQALDHNLDFCYQAFWINPIPSEN